MKTTRAIALVTAVITAAATLSAPSAEARGVGLGVGIGLLGASIGAIHAHNVARQRAEAANARYAARMAAAARAQRAQMAARAAAERKMAAQAAQAKAAETAKAEQAKPVAVATAPRTSQDDNLAAAIDSLRVKPDAKASPKSSGTGAPPVAKVDTKPADAAPAPSPRTASGECKRFIPSAGVTITVPCTE